MDRWINTIYSEPTGYAVVGGNKTPMRELLCHRAARGSPLHHQSFHLLAMPCFAATQCAGGGVATRGHRGQTLEGNQSPLSLCVIQYHACVPMNRRQDIQVQSQRTGHGHIRI